MSGLTRTGGLCGLGAHVEASTPRTTGESAFCRHARTSFYCTVLANPPSAARPSHFVLSIQMSWQPSFPNLPLLPRTFSASMEDNSAQASTVLSFSCSLTSQWHCPLQPQHPARLKARGPGPVAVMPKTTSRNPPRPLQGLISAERSCFVRGRQLSTEEDVQIDGSRLQHASYLQRSLLHRCFSFFLTSPGCLRKDGQTRERFHKSSL